MHVRTILSFALICSALTGCGGSGVPEKTTEGQGEAPAKKTIKTVDATKLPKLGEYLRHLDNAPLEVAPPNGWLPKGRSKEYLAAFVKEKSAAIPAIVLKMSEPVAGNNFADVTPENVIDYAAAVQATLQEPLESALPMVIGQHAFARYVKPAKVGNLPAEVQVLNTVRDGRMYTIELRVRDVEDLKKHRDQAYAVAAGLNFAADAKPFEFKPQTVPAETPPVEAKPADVKAGDSKPADPK